MAEMVSKAVETAMTAMRHSLTELLREGQAATVRKQSEELDALAVRLEGRINRSREHNEQMINMLRTKQMKF